MAKKKPGDLDFDFDLDSGLDDFDFSFGENKIKDDRKPITKVLLDAKQGAIETARSGTFIRKSLKDLFPKSAGDAIDLGDEVAESIKSLYDESVKDIKPTIKQAKNAAIKLIPADSKYLPKALKALLEDWKKENQNAYQDVSANEGREASLSGTLHDIFSAQAVTDNARNGEQLGRENLRDGVDAIRFRSSLTAMNTSAVALQRLDNYQNTVTLKYQKKNLELGYRHLFATQDIGQYLKEDSVRRNELLASIAKNSGLPDFVKLTDPELRQQIEKNKAFSTDKGGIFGNRDKYIQDLQKSITSKIRSGVADANGASSMLLSGLMLGEDTDWKTAIGMGLGSAAMSAGGSMLAQRAGNKLMNSGFSKKFNLQGKFDKLGGTLDNLPNQLNDFSKTNKYLFDDSLMGKLLSGLQSFIPSMSKVGSVTRTSLKDLNGPAPFTKRTDRSINDIIPGYLARIFRELQIMRTGNAGIKLSLFDHDNARFTSSDKLEKSIVKSIIPARNVVATNNKLDSITATIDPTNKLTDEQKEILKHKLLSNSANRDLGNEDNLGNASRYKTGSKADREIVANHMSKHLASHDDTARANFLKMHNHLADSIGEVSDVVQQHMDAGNQAGLRKAGLLNKAGDAINTEAVIKHYRDQQRIAESKKEISQGIDTSKPGHGPMDVYLTGKKLPVLRKDAMSLGQYINTPNKEVLTGPNKISGDIVDSTTMEEEVITPVVSTPVTPVSSVVVSTEVKTIDGIEGTLATMDDGSTKFVPF